MELVGIRRHNMDPVEDEQSDYLKKFIELYPFAAVDFEIPESYINDATDGEFVVTDHDATHRYAEPEECTYCADLQERIDQLEYLIDLERRLGGRSYSGTSSASSLE